MRVSEVFQVQLPQASFVSVDTDAAMQSLTAHSGEPLAVRVFNIFQTILIFICYLHIKLK